MQRRHLWEVPCLTKDALLWTCFDRDELRILARLSCPPPQTPPGLHDEELIVMGTLHRACEGPSEFARRADAQLDALHSDAALELALKPVDEILPWISTPHAARPWPLPAFLWALASDPRPAARALEAGLVWRLVVEGLRAAAFPKVELIEVGR